MNEIEKKLMLLEKSRSIFNEIGLSRLSSLATAIISLETYSTLKDSDVKPHFDYMVAHYKARYEIQKSRYFSEKQEAYNKR